jgi:16S rRNA (uracil1498-N3)-methyltransferase
VKRFLLSEPPDREGLIYLSGKDFHYLIRVRRLGPGDSFKALLPGGGEIQIRIRSLAENILTGECLSETGERPSGMFPVGPVLPPIILFQALPKGTKMDLIVRQAAEGGITRIVPFVSEYTVPRPKSENPTVLERWNRIIKEARQQSGSTVPTAIEAPRSFGELMTHWRTLREKTGVPVDAEARNANGNSALGLLLHQDPLEQGTFHDYLSRGPDLVVLAVGPEGGFSSEEADQFLTEGFKPLLMGNTILRTETAALYAAAAVRIILMERTSWIYKPR